MGKKKIEDFWYLLEKIEEFKQGLEKDAYEGDPADLKTAEEKDAKFRKQTAKLKEAIRAELVNRGVEKLMAVNLSIAIDRLIVAIYSSAYVLGAWEGLADMLSSNKEEAKASEETEGENHVVGPVDAVEIEKSDDPKEDLIFPGYEFAFCNLEDSRVWKGYDRFDDFMKGVCTDAGLSKFKSVYKNPELLEKHKKEKKADKKKRINSIYAGPVTPATEETKKVEEDRRLPKTLPVLKHWRLRFQDIIDIIDGVDSKKKQDKKIEKILVNFFDFELSAEKVKHYQAKKAVELFTQLKEVFYLAGETYLTRVERVLYTSYDIHKAITSAIEKKMRRDADSFTYKYYETVILRFMAYGDKKKKYIFDIPSKQVSMEYLADDLLRAYVKKKEVTSKSSAIKRTWKAISRSFNPKSGGANDWMFRKDSNMNLIAGDFLQLTIEEWFKGDVNVDVDTEAYELPEKWRIATNKLHSMYLRYQDQFRGDHVNKVIDGCNIFACAVIIEQGFQRNGIDFDHTNGSDDWLFQLSLDMYNTFIPENDKRPFIPYAEFIFKAFRDYYMEEETTPENFRISKYLIEGYMTSVTLHDLYLVNPYESTILTLSAAKGWNWTSQWGDIPEKDVQCAYLMACLLNPKFCGVECETKKAIHDQLAKSMLEPDMKLMLRRAILSILMSQKEIDWCVASDQFIKEFSSDYERDTLECLWITALKGIIERPHSMDKWLSQKWDHIVDLFTELIKTFEATGNLSTRMLHAFLLRGEVPTMEEDDKNLLSNLLKEDPERFKTIYRGVLSDIYVNVFYNATEETRKEIAPLGIYEAYNHFIFENVPEIDEVFGDRILKECYFEILNAFSCLDTGNEEGREDLLSFIACEVAKDLDDPDGRLDLLRVAVHRACIHLGEEEANAIAIDVFDRTPNFSAIKNEVDEKQIRSLQKFCKMVESISVPNWYKWGVLDQSEESFLIHILTETVLKHWLSYYPIPTIFKEGVTFLTRFFIDAEDRLGSEYISPKLASWILGRITGYRMDELGKNFYGIFDFTLPLFNECVLKYGALSWNVAPVCAEFTNFVYEKIQTMLSNPEMKFFSPEALYSLSDEIKGRIYQKGKEEIAGSDHSHTTVQRFRCDLVKYLGYSYLSRVDEKFSESGNLMLLDIVYLAVSGREIDPAAKNRRESDLIENCLMKVQTVVHLEKVVEEVMYGALLGEKGIYNIDLEEMHQNLLKFLDRFVIDIGTDAVSLEKEGRCYMANSYKQLLNHFFKERHKVDFTEENEKLLTEAGLKSLEMYKKFKESIK